MKAVWKDTVLAQSDSTIIVEGNYYFPPEDVKNEYLRESDMHTSCPWKGEASYYDISVNGEVLTNAAWYYPQPKEAAENITNYVAFWKDAHITE